MGVSVNYVVTGPALSQNTIFGEMKDIVDTVLISNIKSTNTAMGHVDVPLPTSLASIVVAVPIPADEAVLAVVPMSWSDNSPVLSGQTVVPATAFLPEPANQYNSL